MSTHAVLLPQRTPRSAFGKLLQNEGRYAWRVPVGLLMGVAVPVGVLVIMGVIPGANKPVKSLGGLTVFSTYFPVLIAFALAMIALMSLPGHLADYRQQGILRRLSTTPVPPAWSARPSGVSMATIRPRSIMATRSHSRSASSM